MPDSRLLYGGRCWAVNIEDLVTPLAVLGAWFLSLIAIASERKHEETVVCPLAVAYHLGRSLRTLNTNTGIFEELLHGEAPAPTG